MKKITLIIVIWTTYVLGQTALQPSGNGTSTDDPYLISTLENLYWIIAPGTVDGLTLEQRWNRYYKQTNDIDASSTSTWDNNNGWTPIGIYSPPFDAANNIPFRGSYNGNGKTISGLTINRPSSDFVGFFCLTMGATISNLGLTDVNITGSQMVGGLVGFNFANIINCYTTGTITAIQYTGGLVGSHNSSTISNSFSTCAVSGGWKAGGLVGENSAPINSCYSAGTTTGDSQIGGFVGSNFSTITNCYSRSNVIRSSGSSTLYFGGFAGWNYVNKILYCYSIGSVKDSDGNNIEGKGFLGYTHTGSGYQMLGNFWDITSSTQISSGGSTDNGSTLPVGLTTMLMQTQTTFTNAGWDFIDIWEIVGSNYPRLRSNPDQALPVELTTFTAISNGNEVFLHWQTATEVNNYGFAVEREVQGTSCETWKKIAFVQGHGNSNSPKEYSFTDSNPPSGKVKYRLKQIDFDGKYEYSDEIEVNVEAPANFVLEQNHPNPFNPETTISYHIPFAGKVLMTVFDILGREVAKLVNQEKPAGRYEVKFNGQNLPSGIYFYSLRCGNFIQTKKLLLLK